MRISDWSSDVCSSDLIDSVGNVGFPQSSIFTPVLSRPCGTPLPPGDVVNPACFLTPEIQTFANGAAVPNNLKADYTTVLPSFNVRLDRKSTRLNSSH